MAGHDVMAAAQTGTGKTAGFALPIINALMPLASHSASPARHPVRALIIAPTRELADQIHDNVKTYIQFTPLRSAAVSVGSIMQPQTNALRAGVEILIATPGRLLDHVQQKSVNLSQVQLLVLDEARPDAGHGLPARHPAHHQSAQPAASEPHVLGHLFRTRSASWPNAS